MSKLLRSLTAALLLSGLAAGWPANAAVRKSVTSLTSDEVASLRRGVAQMKAWDNSPIESADYRRSWVYWANMHEYFGDDCATEGFDKPGMSGLSQHHASNQDQMATWCTCQHSPQNGINPNFLTWHRMYLYYFEKVLQAAAGDPNLELPFWNYQNDGHLPPIYRYEKYGKPKFQRDNPLYTVNRAPGLNDGSVALSSDTVSSDDAMHQSSYELFSAFLEGTPHGTVHCAVGVADCGSGYMGTVPAAANDAIFWAHHATIDRLYECWLSDDPAHRLPTSSDVLDATFTFPDETGTLVTRKVSDMLTTQQLGYHYAGWCPGRIPIRLLATVQRVPFWVTVIGANRIKGSGTTSIPLTITDEAKRALRPFLSRRGTRVGLLRISGIRSNRVPSAMYRVALRDSSGRVRTLGLLNFFNMTSHHAMAHGDEGFAQSFVLPSADVLAGGGQLLFEPTTGLTGRAQAQRAARLNADVQIRFDTVAVSFQ